MPAAFSIPTVDLATDSPERQAEKIKHALSSVGFLCVVNSGIDADLVDTMFEHVSVPTTPTHDTSSDQYTYTNQPVGDAIQPAHAGQRGVLVRGIRDGIYQDLFAGIGRGQGGP